MKKEDIELVAGHGFSRGTLTLSDGTVVITDGAFALIWDGKQKPMVARPCSVPKFEAQWNATARELYAAKGLLEGADAVYREYVGTSDAVYFNELFLRCIAAGREVQVFSTATNRDPFLVFAEGVRIGIIMPLQNHPGGVSVGGVTDEELLSPYAQECNEWRGLTKQDAEARLVELRDDLESAEEKLRRAEDARDEAEREYNRMADLIAERFNCLKPPSPE